MNSKPIRIVVDAMPQLLRDIIEGAVNLQPDMQLVDTGDEPHLSAAIKHSAPPRRHSRGTRRLTTASAHRELLVEHPLLKIFVVTDDGLEANLAGVPSDAGRGHVAAGPCWMRSELRCHDEAEDRWR